MSDVTAFWSRDETYERSLLDAAKSLAPSGGHAAAHVTPGVSMPTSRATAHRNGGTDEVRVTLPGTGNSVYSLVRPAARGSNAARKLGLYDSCTAVVFCCSLARFRETEADGSSVLKGHSREFRALVRDCHEAEDNIAVILARPRAGHGCFEVPSKSEHESLRYEVKKTSPFSSPRAEAPGPTQVERQGSGES